MFHSSCLPFARSAAVAAVAVALSAQSVAANCPASPEDAFRGLSVTYDDGTTLAMRLLANGLQEDIETYDDGSDAYYILAKHGVFSVEEADIVDGARVPRSSWTFTYPGGIDSLPEIVPELRWEGRVTRIEFGGATVEWKMSVTAGRLVDVNHAGCALRVIPVVSRVTDHTGVESFIGYDYIPAAGLALFRAYSETPVPDDIATITSFGPYPSQ